MSVNDLPADTALSRAGSLLQVGLCDSGECEL